MNGEMLRQMAEVRLKGSTTQLAKCGPRKRFLAHELEVHRIELELQNEELQRAQTALNAVRERYVELYERAPVALVTIDRGGRIVEANPATSAILGADGALVGKPLSSFMRVNDADAFHLARESVLDMSTRKYARTIGLRGREGTYRNVLLTMTRSSRPDEIHCAIVEQSVSADELLRYRVPSNDIDGAPPRERAKGSMRTVLVVEDEVPSRHAIERLIASTNLRILGAGSVDDAREIAAAEPIDILLTDIRLPDGRGDSLAERLRMLYPDIAVVYMSGEPPSATRVPGIYLEKPLDIEDLRCVIESLRTSARPGPASTPISASPHSARVPGPARHKIVVRRKQANGKSSEFVIRDLGRIAVAHGLQSILQIADRERGHGIWSEADPEVLIDDSLVASLGPHTTLGNVVKVALDRLTS